MSETNRARVKPASTTKSRSDDVTLRSDDALHAGFLLHAQSPHLNILVGDEIQLAERILKAIRADRGVRVGKRRVTGSKGVHHRARR